MKTSDELLSKDTNYENVPYYYKKLNADIFKVACVNATRNAIEAVNFLSRYFFAKELKERLPKYSITEENYLTTLLSLIMKHPDCVFTISLLNELQIPLYAKHSLEENLDRIKKEIIAFAKSKDMLFDKFDGQLYGVLSDESIMFYYNISLFQDSKRVKAAFQLAKKHTSDIDSLTLYELKKFVDHIISFVMNDKNCALCLHYFFQSITHKSGTSAELFISSFFEILLGITEKEALALSRDNRQLQKNLQIKQPISSYIGLDNFKENPDLLTPGHLKVAVLQASILYNYDYLSWLKEANSLDNSASIAQFLLEKIYPRNNKLPDSSSAVYNFFSGYTSCQEKNYVEACSNPFNRIVLGLLFEKPGAPRPKLAKMVEIEKCLLDVTRCKRMCASAFSLFQAIRPAIGVDDVTNIIGQKIYELHKLEDQVKCDQLLIPQ